MYFTAAISEYAKRLSKYCKLKQVERADEKAPENLSDKEMEQVKDKEGERILAKISDQAYVVALAIGGKQLEAQIARADELELKLKNTSSGVLDYEYAKDKLSRVDEFLGDADHEKIKTLLHLMIDSIEITKEKSIKNITIRWNEHIQSFIEASSPENGEEAFLLVGIRKLFLSY